MKTKVPNQIHRDLMGVCGLNPWDGHDSSSRKQMMSSHISQTLVIKGATERRCQTGMEREFGKYTFSTKMPVDAEIIKVIERYRHTIGQDSIRKNPQSIVLYEDVNTKEIGMLSVTEHCSYHQYFGFPYKNKPALSQIHTGAFIKAGTILQDSPSITDSGGYMFGRECNFAFASLPAASEDGVVVSRDILPKLGFTTYEHRVVEWGSKRFPLNLYGDAENFKAFPDIGDLVRPDGLLMCLRTFDELLSPVEQNINDLREPDYVYDKCTYAVGTGGRIVDIKVHHDTDSSYAGTPMGMELQAERYDNHRRHFYSELLAEHARLRRQRGAQLRITPELHRMLVEAQSVVGDTKGKRVNKLYRQSPLDDWRVEFVIQFDIVPTIGFKISDLHGGS